MNKSTLQTIFTLLDYTSLEGTDTNSSIQKWITQLLKNQDELNKKQSSNIHVAAVCVYPVFIATAKKTLAGSGIKVTSVAGAFPHGQLPVNLKLNEINYALEQGADEIDFVISRANVIEQNLTALFDEVSAAKEKCGTKILKVILETGELPANGLINLASQTAIAAGADFIKTSTGKIQPGATLNAVELMLKSIKTHYDYSGKKVGIKPSGGIADVETATQYLDLVLNVTGNDWVNPNLFRIGASRLLKDLSDKLLID